MASDRAGEWRAWWGMARARTHDLETVLHYPELHEVQDCVRRARAVAGPDARGEIDRRWPAYRAKVRRARDEEYTRLGLGDLEARRLGAFSVAEASQCCRELEAKTRTLANQANRKRIQAKGARNRLLVPVVALIALIPLYHLVEQIPLGNGAVSVLSVLACAVFWIAAYIVVTRREADRLERRLARLVAEHDRLKADLDGRARLDGFRRRWGEDGEAA